LGTSLFELQTKVENILKDVEKKSKQVLDKYKDNLPAIPPDYNKAKDPRISYASYYKITEAIDEMISVEIRITLVINQLEGIVSGRFPRELSNEPKLVKNFVDKMRGEIKILQSYRDQLEGVMWTLKDKIKVLQGLLVWGS